MIKLITPIGILVAVALLAVYAAYAFWTAYVDRSWLFVIVGAASFVACIGAAMLRAWSQYLVYALTAGFIVAWCHSVYAAAMVGFFSFFFSSTRLVVAALAPGLALVFISCAASYLTYRHFRSASTT